MKLFAVASVAAALPLVIATASPRSATAPRSHVTAPTVTVPCKPADKMTSKQRAALIASLPGDSGIRRCTPPGRSSRLHAAAGSSAIRLTAFVRPSMPQHFVSRTHYRLSNVSLSDQTCDSRAVYADLYDQAGWEGYEFVNRQGCNSVAYWAGPLDFYDTSYGVQYVQIHLYACNANGCSSVKLSKQHKNPYYAGQTSASDSTFDFCNVDSKGNTLACFYAHL